MGLRSLPDASLGCSLLVKFLLPRLCLGPGGNPFWLCGSALGLPDKAPHPGPWQQKCACPSLEGTSWFCLVFVSWCLTF